MSSFYFWHCASKSFCVRGGVLGCRPFTLVSTDHSSPARRSLVHLLTLCIWSPRRHAPVPWQVFVASPRCSLILPLTCVSLLIYLNRNTAFNKCVFSLTVSTYLAIPSQHFERRKFLIEVRVSGKSKIDCEKSESIALASVILVPIQFSRE